MDDTDKAQAADAALQDDALQRQQQRSRREAMKPKLQPIGECHNALCGLPLDAEKLFCGADCATAHGKRSKI